MSDVPAWDAAYESDLIRRCQAGEKTAFEPIVKHYMRRAYFTALGLVGDPHSAEDLSQDAFARAFRNIRGFDAKAPFFPWFYRLLRNLCLNHIRGRKRRLEDLTDLSDETGPEISSEVSTPEQDCESEEVKREIWRALNKLGEADREILILKHFEEMSYQEIADALNIAPGTVMSRLYNARQRLREQMKGYL